jgi:hypothetical protein
LSDRFVKTVENLQTYSTYNVENARREGKCSGDLRPFLFGVTLGGREKAAEI